MIQAKKLKTGDVRKALQQVWPHITDDMVREAADRGDIDTEPLNPLAEKTHRVYNAESLKSFLQACPGVPLESYQRIIQSLGIE